MTTPSTDETLAPKALDAEKIARLFDWMVDGAPGAKSPVDVLQRFGDEVRGAGIGLERAAAFVRTLHPHIMGRSFTWEPGRSVVVREAPFETVHTEGYQRSAVHFVTTTGESVRARLETTSPPRSFPILDDLARQGFTDYYATALRFMSGQIHGITFATKRAGGFTDAEIAAIDHLLRPLARVAEILALTRTAVNLLNTYVGRNAGERILNGHIVRGHADAIRAFIWFSDLRGFTELTSRAEPVAVIRVLNELFECQVPAIEKHGGEVLKFMGDGLLAIFPIDGPPTSAPLSGFVSRADAPGAEISSALAETPFRAAEDAYAAVAALNTRRVAEGEAPVRFGLALHVGDVAYGNIGGASRLDFTCIGSAVNLAARLEGLTGKVDRPVVVSDDLARITERPLDALGAFDLKGVDGARSVFSPADGVLSRW